MTIASNRYRDPALWRSESTMEARDGQPAAADSMPGERTLTEMLPVVETDAPISGFTIAPPAKPPTDAEVQLTLGSTMDRLHKVYERFHQTAGYKEWKQKRRRDPMMRSLSAAGQGLLLLLVDHVRSAWVRPITRKGLALRKQRFRHVTGPARAAEHKKFARFKRNVRAGKRGELPFPKGAFPMMARTDFVTIFDLLDMRSRKLLSKMRKGHRVLRNRWIRWIVQTAIPTDKRWMRTRLRERLLNYAFENSTDLTLTRGQWIRDVPPIL
jgi:hypothetical protein